jgi:PAS domain-containing protein
MPSAFNPEGVVQAAVAALANRAGPAPASFDDLPGALYATDAEGLITHYNKACIDFAGRVPTLNRDRWCVTWKLFREDDSFLPHDQCPMAVAIRQRQPVRGVTAIARRPDGTQASFAPYPTPVFDAAGAFIGAVNLLVDITGWPEREHWLQEARRCRRLARTVSDLQTIASLESMATEYEAKARECVFESARLRT